MLADEESALPELDAEPVSPPVDEPVELDELVLDPLSVGLELELPELDVELFVSVVEPDELVVLSAEPTGEVLGLGLISGEEAGAGVASTLIEGLGLGFEPELPTLDVVPVEVVVELFCDPED